jgi:SAM-dependent methyltransferase
VALMDAMYTAGEYLKRNPTWHEEDASWKARQITRMIKENAVAPSSMCEVGCGTGQILVELARDFPSTKLVGYEISPQAFELWQEKGNSTIEYRLRDIFDGCAEHFDMLLIIDVIEHIEDVYGFLKKLQDLSDLKIFHIPLDLSVQSVWRSSPLTNLRRDVGHIHYFTAETALSTLRDCGYEIINYRYTASRLELPNQALSSQIMAAPRRIFFRMHAGLTVRILGGYSLLVLAR